mmetsp:Transcript_31364/g.79920  ORF Transcript_31364/g.79920 Transcript_31364/m.79920 type:complete len:85 (-) Transcript_31364:183-437(-)
MPFTCACRWSSRGGLEDMVAHLRGKHSIEIHLPTQRKWLPPSNATNGGNSPVGHCVGCDLYLHSTIAILDHVGELHDVSITKRG